MSTPQQYSNSDAQVLMTLAATAYAGEGGTTSQIQAAITSALAAAELTSSYTLTWLGISSDMSNLVYVAQGGGALNVAVRGTDWNFLENWVDDFDVIHQHGWPTASPPNSDIMVAQGAWDGLTALLGTTSQVFGSGSSTAVSLADYLQSQATAASNAGTQLTINVTGHSLGGAMATVLGLWIADTVPSWKLTANTVVLNSYTFAAPTVGNQAFVDYYNGQPANTQVVWQAFRVWNEQDVVPHAYGNLNTVVTSGIPLHGIVFVGELIFFISGVETALQEAGVSYIQVLGSGHGLDNANQQAGTSSCTSGGNTNPCPNPAESMSDFACWACYEHDHNTYLKLLGAPTTSVLCRALDVASIAAMKAPSPLPVKGISGQPAEAQGG